MVAVQVKGERHAGLSMVNSTKLDYFNDRQKAELFRLKGEFLNALGDDKVPDSQAALSHSMWVCDSYAKGWLSWAHLLDRMYVQWMEGAR